MFKRKVRLISLVLKKSASAPELFKGRCNNYQEGEKKRADVKQERGDHVNS